MKLGRSLLFCLVLLLVNCMPGSQREACRYNLQELKVRCELVSLLIASSPNEEGFLRSNEANLLLFSQDCIKYWNRLEDCKKEENNYIPSIYG